MLVENFSDLYFYKELYGEDFHLYADEIMEAKAVEAAVNEEIVEHEPTPVVNVETKPQAKVVEEPKNTDHPLEQQAEVKKEVVVDVPVQQPVKHLLKNREGIRDRFVEYYKHVLQTNSCPLFRAQKQFIFGAGNVNELDIMFLYSEATEHDEQNSKKPMTDPNGRMLLIKLKESGINLKNSFIAPIIKCKPDKVKGNLTSIVKDINIRMTLNQVEILSPPIVVIFGLDLGLNVIKSTKDKTDLTRNDDEYLHNLRNRLITMKSGYKAIVTYDYHELIHDKTKMNEFFTKDLPFIVRQYKELL